MWCNPVAQFHGCIMFICELEAGLSVWRNLTTELSTMAIIRLCRNVKLPFSVEYIRHLSSFTKTLYEIHLVVPKRHPFAPYSLSWETSECHHLNSLPLSSSRNQSMIMMTRHGESISVPASALWSCILQWCWSFYRKESLDENSRQMMHGSSLLWFAKLSLSNRKSNQLIVSRSLEPWMSQAISSWFALASESISYSWGAWKPWLL